MPDNRLAIPTAGSNTRLFGNAVWDQRLLDVERFDQSLPSSIIDGENSLTSFHVLLALFSNGTRGLRSYYQLATGNDD